MWHAAAHSYDLPPGALPPMKALNRDCTFARMLNVAARKSKLATLNWPTGAIQLLSDISSACSNSRNMCHKPAPELQTSLP